MIIILLFINKYLISFQNSMSALPPLMKAMNQENVVALVRRVYQKNSTPKLGLLIPEENSKNGQVNNSLWNTVFPHIRPTCITFKGLSFKGHST